MNIIEYWELSNKLLQSVFKEHREDLGKEPKMYILTITRTRKYSASIETRERHSSHPHSAAACFEIMKLALEDLDENETVSFKLSLSK